MNISDDELFKDPPPKEECSICLLPIPYAPGACGVRVVYQPCCGKILCEGCNAAAIEEIRKGNMKDCCAFCRIPSPRTIDDFVKRLKNRMKLMDAEAFHVLGRAYRDGEWGLPRSINKALELLKQAAQLGSVTAQYNIAEEYYKGRYVGRNRTKALHHYTLAAIGGHEVARHNLGVTEEDKGITYRSPSLYRRGMKHYMIAAKCGDDDSLKQVGVGHKYGHVTKDEYATTLRVHQQTRDDMKSEQRDKAQKATIYVLDGAGY